MRKILALALVAGCAVAQAQTSVSIGINQPGVYGRITIGDIPPPALVLPQPVIIERTPVVVQRAPIYLYVPPAHQHDWRRYCGRYSACNQPVYFVRDDYVRERWQKEHPGRHLGHDKAKHDKPKGHGPQGKAKGHDKNH